MPEDIKAFAGLCSVFPAGSEKAVGWETWKDCTKKEVTVFLRALISPEIKPEIEVSMSPLNSGGLQRTRREQRKGCAPQLL